MRSDVGRTGVCDGRECVIYSCTLLPSPLMISWPWAFRSVQRRIMS